MDFKAAGPILMKYLGIFQIGPTGDRVNLIGSDRITRYFFIDFCHLDIDNQCYPCETDEGRLF